MAVRTIEQSVLAFTGSMLAKLRARDGKNGRGDGTNRGWLSQIGDHPYAMRWLEERLAGEIQELHLAILRGEPSEIIDEATDVANFCMMIADNAREMRGD